MRCAGGTLTRSDQGTQGSGGGVWTLDSQTGHVYAGAKSQIGTADVMNRSTGAHGPSLSGAGRLPSPAEGANVIEQRYHTFQPWDAAVMREAYRSSWVGYEFTPIGKGNNR